MTTTTDDAELIRREHGVPAEVGRRVIYTSNGAARPGTITRFYGRLLGVRLDGQRHSTCLHPTRKLQYLDEVVGVPALPMGLFVPDGSELEATYYGVPVVAFESGGHLALATDKRRALAALNAYAREFHQFRNLADDASATAEEALAALDPRWVVFEWQPEDSDYQWSARFAKEGDECAVPCIWLGK